MFASSAEFVLHPYRLLCKGTKSPHTLACMPNTCTCTRRCRCTQSFYTYCRVSLCMLSLSKYSSVGYLPRVWWQQLKIIPFIPRNPPRQKYGVLLRKVVKESYKVFNHVQLQSMVGHPLSITMNSCGQPCGQLALRAIKRSFPVIAVHVIIGRYARWRWEINF